MAYLFAAYSVVWIALFAYIFVLHGQVRALRRDLERAVRDRAERAKA